MRCWAARSSTFPTAPSRSFGFPCQVKRELSWSRLNVAFHHRLGATADAHSSITCHYERAIRSGGSSKTKLEQLTKKEKDDELAALRAMYMMQRQACSHLFNTESWLRNSCSLSHLQFLLEDLNNRGATATLLEQLLKAAPNWLKQFSTGLKELRKLANPTLCGYIDVAGLVSSIANEKRLMRTKCASCPAKPPVSPMFAKVSLIFF